MYILIQTYSKITIDAYPWTKVIDNSRPAFAIHRIYSVDGAEFPCADCFLLSKHRALICPRGLG